MSWKPKFKVGRKVIAVLANHWTEINIALVEIIGYYEDGYKVNILKVIRQDSDYGFNRSNRMDNLHCSWIEKAPLRFKDEVTTIIKKEIKESEQLKQHLSILEEQTFIIDSYIKEKVSFT